MGKVICAQLLHRPVGIAQQTHVGDAAGFQMGRYTRQNLLEVERHSLPLAEQASALQVREITLECRHDNEKDLLAGQPIRDQRVDRSRQR